MPRPPLACLALLAFAACDMYGRTYVLYDGKKAGGGRAGVVQAHDDPEIARIFELELVLLELDAAVRDGLDSGGVLRDKRVLVEEELLRRRAAAGDRYHEARRERVGRLAEFEVR